MPSSTTIPSGIRSDGVAPIPSRVPCTTDPTSPGDHTYDENCVGGQVPLTKEEYEASHGGGGGGGGGGGASGPDYTPLNGGYVITSVETSGPGGFGSDGYYDTGEVVTMETNDVAPVNASPNTVGEGRLFSWFDWMGDWSGSKAASLETGLLKGISSGLAGRAVVGALSFVW